jgi:flagellar assembly protein FliH
MANTQLIAFDRKLAGIALPGDAGRLLTETELAARAEQAFRRGVDSARALADQQMVEYRSDIKHLSDGLLSRVASLEASMTAQLNASLPSLAVEIARRLLAGFEPPPDVVSRLCNEALEELFPERENLELVVSTRDAELLGELNPAWGQRYPGLKITSEPSLGPGDCQVRSRFGLIDGRMATKLSALEHNLVSQ